MPSFSLTSSPAMANSSAGSVRGTIITYARSILPSLPASWYDFIPFVLAGLMALLFTALLVLLVEDSEDVYPHSPRNSQTTTLQKEKRIKRLVGLAEQDAEDEHNDDEWAWDPRADTSTSRTNLKESQDWLRIQNEKMQESGHGYRYRTTSRRLLASPPPSASPQSPEFTPPILSMAKLIMHRHDQSSKRARASSSRPSPPPSPPAASGVAFAHMQYTLKSAAIKDAKVSMVAFPSSSEDDSLPSPPASPTSPLPPSDAAASSSLPSPPPTPTGPSPAASSTLTPTPKPTRHARSRSVASLSISALPTLVPALQLLKPPSPTSPNERTLRRKRSSMLEEGGVPASSEADQDQAYHSQQCAAPTPSPSREVSPESPSSSSSSQDGSGSESVQRKSVRSKERRSRKRSGSGAKKIAAQTHQRADVPPPLPSLGPFGRRRSEGIAAMEEGARR